MTRECELCGGELGTDAITYPGTDGLPVSVCGKCRATLVGDGRAANTDKQLVSWFADMLLAGRQYAAELGLYPGRTPTKPDDSGGASRG